jgi:hypothetical protein
MRIETVQKNMKREKKINKLIVVIRISLMTGSKILEPYEAPN